jgi:hypothetical protein
MDQIEEDKCPQDFMTPRRLGSNPHSADQLWFREGSDSPLNNGLAKKWSFHSP